MALDNYLGELETIKGFKAGGIMTYTGDLLASESVDGGIDLGMVGATFNDIFRSSHEVCEKIGLEATTEMSIQTPKGVVVMRCSGVEAKAHVHMIAILSRDGNQALTKMQLEKMAPGVMDELA